MAVFTLRQQKVRFLLGFFLLLFAYRSLGQTSGGSPLNNGLVVWLKLDEPAGTQAADASGSGRTATVVDGAGWQPGGKVGGAVQLGVGSSLRIPLAWQPTRFSICWWVKATSRAYWNQTVGASLNYEAGGWWNGFLFHTAGDGRVYLGTDADTWMALPAETFRAGVWQHFAFTYDAGVASLYKDGQLLRTQPGMSAPAPWRELAVGSTLAAAQAADGLYDDVRVYDRALPAQQVLDLFNGNTTAYVPPNEPSDDQHLNWSLSRTFDGNGTPISEAKVFADALGRTVQAQAKSFTSRHVFATHTIYNSQGKPALSTLPAPINNQAFNFKEDFIRDNTGQPYSDAAFEGTNAGNPLPVSNSALGTLGYYYSANNTLEPYTATTTHPFSLAESFTDPIGGVKRAAGPGDALRMGSGREAKARQFVVLDELAHYASLRQHFVPGTPAGATYKHNAYKAVSIGADGTESIVFTDAAGQTLATCLSGPDYAPIQLGTLLVSYHFPAITLPTFREIHVPAAGDVQLSVANPNTTISPYSVGYVQDVLTGTSTPFTVTDAPISLTLRPGFYRIVAEYGAVACSYPARYGHFSYTYYDDAGRAVASVAPAGVDLNSPAAPAHTTRSQYDGLGQLLRATSADEGETRYVYARDGRLRFSQSAQQRADHTFSYVNYDRTGRPVETGLYAENTTDPTQGLVFEDHLTATPSANSVLQAAVLESRQRTGGLDAAQCREQHSTWYDQTPDVVPGNRTPRFGVGTTTKTSNATAATWYSYDELGRVEWMVQQLQGLGTKTVDYTYDFNGNVLEVAYQKGQPDAYYHHYTYDADQRLSAVHTSPDGGTTKTLQATYVYYLHGPLKRVSTLR